MNGQTTAVSTWFWVVAVLAVAWNALGVVAYLADVNQTSAELASMSPTMQELYAARPSWAIAGFAVAVFGGLLGGLLLLLRKRLAAVLFLLSLIGLLVQNFYWFGMAKAHQLFPATSHIMPLMVVIVAIFLLWFARASAAKGWLK